MPCKYERVPAPGGSVVLHVSGRIDGIRSGMGADLRLERTGQHSMAIKNHCYDGLRKPGTC
jgi:hypothetical protein